MMSKRSWWEQEQIKRSIALITVQMTIQCAVALNCNHQVKVKGSALPTLLNERSNGAPGLKTKLLKERI